MADDWDAGENAAIVEDYFSMLKSELQARPYSKATHRRALKTLLRNRTDGSIERKHQNISAILKERGLPFIQGYKPLINYQENLARTVDSHLGREGLTWLFGHSEEPMPEEGELRSRSIEDLREAALAAATENQTPRQRLIAARLRAAAIKVYAKRRAGGRCEGCRQVAPFLGVDGEPFLEVHHLRRLSDGGPDHPDAVVAICPNCHRRVHGGLDGPEWNEDLAKSRDTGSLSPP